MCYDLCNVKFSPKVACQSSCESDYQYCFVLCETQASDWGCCDSQTNILFSCDGILFDNEPDHFPSHQNFHWSFGNWEREDPHDYKRVGGWGGHHQAPADHQWHPRCRDHHRSRQLHHQHQGKGRIVPQLCKGPKYVLPESKYLWHLFTLSLMQNLCETSVLIFGVLFSYVEEEILLGFPPRRYLVFLLDWESVLL